MATDGSTDLDGASCAARTSTAESLPFLWHRRQCGLLEGADFVGKRTLGATGFPLLFEASVVLASAVFFLVRLFGGRHGVSLVSSWLLGGEHGACECRLLSSLRQGEQSLEFLRGSGALAVRARGMVCRTSQLGVPSLFSGAIFSRCRQIFWESSMTRSWCRRGLGGGGDAGSLTPRCSGHMLHSSS